MRQVAIGGKMLFCYRLGVRFSLWAISLQAAYRATRPAGRWMATGSISLRVR